MDPPERFEQLIAFLDSNLPPPVQQEEGDDGGIVFTAGDPAEVVVHLTPSSVVVSEYAGTWDGRHSFTARPRRVGIVKWKRLPETPLFNVVTQLIKGAREMRLGRYRTCPYCETPTPPESLNADGLCLSCAERYRGVVH
jgi:hypothetical protein